MLKNPDLQRKKDYLQRYVRTVQRIDRKTDELLQWHKRAEIFASTSKPKAETENTLASIIETEFDIREEIKELNNLRNRVNASIESLLDENLKFLLELKYIDGKTFEEIAEIMMYDWRHIIRLHNKALSQISVP